MLNQLPYTLEQLHELRIEGLEGLTQSMLDAHWQSVLTHISYVQEAGKMVGGLSPAQLEIHDDSKFSIREFPHYARQFHGPKDDPDGFAGAWLHHIHRNPHHWQYWIFPDGHTPKGSSIENGVVPMPEIYVREMIADWMGAGRTYTGSWDMTDWLLANLPRIRLHSRSAQILESVLCQSGLGYQGVYAELRANGTIP